MAASIEEDKWTTTIQQLFLDGRLTSHQCIVYNKNSRAQTDDEKCGCQRPIRHHSFDGSFSEVRPKPEDWNVKDHTKKLQQLIYHSTPSRKVSFSKSSCIHDHEIFSLISHLVFKVCV
jgi:hypothetical protein